MEIVNKSEMAHPNERPSLDGDVESAEDNLPIPHQKTIHTTNKEARNNTFLWSVDDDTLFWPLGLKNQYNDHGKSLIITWDENYLLNFVMKKSRGRNGITMTKIRIDMPQGNGEQSEVIKEIVILELNSLVLMESGRIYYFSSMKSIQQVDWLDNVRCIAKVDKGFGVICVKDDQNSAIPIRLEIYEDVFHIGQSCSTMLHSYDITFDELNPFSAHWTDDHFTLSALTVDENNVEFVKRLTMEFCELYPGQEIYFFSISGNLFVLAPNKDTAKVENEAESFSIRLLCTYVANAEFIHIDCQQRLCLLLLDNGSIDIWHLAAHTKAIKRKMHHLGFAITHYDFSAEDVCFFFTDAEKIALIHFAYEDKLDTWQVRENFKAIPNIVACSWIGSLRQLICLSVNNIFYQIPFADTIEKLNQALENGHNFENLLHLYELTPTSLEEFVKTSNNLKALSKYPTELHSEIYKECAKRELMSLIHKIDSLDKNIKASVTWAKELAPIAGNSNMTVFPRHQKSGEDHSPWAILRLSFKDTPWVTESAHLWYLCIECTSISYVLPVIGAEPCVVAIPLARSFHTLLPEVHMRLISSVSNNYDYKSNNLIISIPVFVESSPNLYTKLFQFQEPPNFISIDYDISGLVREINNKSEISCTSLDLNHVLAFATPTALEAVLANFTKDDSARVEDTNPRNIYFINSPVTITYNKDSNFIILRSPEAAALYYAKLNLYGSVASKDILLADALQEAIHKFQGQVECFLCKGEDNEVQTYNYSIENKPLNSLRRLKNVYINMRKELHI